MICTEVDVGIGLVITQEDVVSRSQFLDPIGLEQ